MVINRRHFLRASAGVGAGVAMGQLTGCKDPVTGLSPPVPYQPGKPLPWINWAANQHCYPQWRHAPASTEEVVDVMRSAKGTIRAVGSGHSFSAQVPTDDTLISTDLMSGLVSHDPERRQATLLGGTTLHDMGPLLDRVGQAVPNMPDMDYPTLAGAVANSVHATGNRFGSMSAYVVGMRIVTPTGEVIDCSRDHNAAVFQAARTSLGALGIATEITLQNQASFDLTEVNRFENINDVWDSIDERCRRHRHFEFFPLPYADVCITVATDLARPGDSDVGEDDPQAAYDLRTAFDATAWLPLVGDKLYNSVLKVVSGQVGETVRTGKSWQVFPHVRTIRFREMEYTVPAEAGPDCVKEILQAVRDKRLDLCFPFEYRYVDADDIWLSMFEGRPGCSISIHQWGDMDYRPVFAEIEPIFWKYEGRPHWGKLHSLGAEQLAALYPRHWQDFLEVRAALDPEGRMLNAHLHQVLGV